MIGRNRRGNRQASMKARLGIAAAVLAGGSAVGVAAVAATSHGSPTTTAQSAGYSMNFRHTISVQNGLPSALGSWGQSQQRSLTTLAQMKSMRWFGTVWQHRTQFAAQRGIVVLATKKFLVVRSANGSLHVWWLTGGTKFRNVSATATGMTALTGNNWAAKAAMMNNNMAPAATVMAGSTTMANQMMAPVAKPTTITVNTGTQTITITIAPNNTATMAPVTTPTPMPTPTMMATQPAFTRTMGVTRGSLVFVVGVKVHGSLLAKLVLFAAPATVTPTPTGTPTMTVTPTAPATGTVVPSSSATFSGTHA